ncbi:uncharacterized protein EHS24_007792 [Apiotrichum porosum]|uniref:Uncharacterized protein n=1 Tax=Apiotrichum porosum TaxID=105984 RepID=A0A427XRZ7_9TREE|nr:uncharacterized protein EHS24_007792 [Apiotrichum porosum]RSH81614.1 hypothetical protein EHS24_007792 [Apiotrichum porosum]
MTPEFPSSSDCEPSDPSTTPHHYAAPTSNPSFLALIELVPQPPPGSWANLVASHPEWFTACKLPREIRIDLAGVFAGQATGTGNARLLTDVLARMLFPHRFDAFGRHTPLGIVPSITFGSAEWPSNNMGRAYAAVERYNRNSVETKCATRWMTARCQAACLQVVAYAALVIVPTTLVHFLSEALTRIRPCPSISTEDLTSEQRLREAATLIQRDRACTANEAVAQAVGQAAFLHEATGLGFGMAMAGPKFARTVALSHHVICVELLPRNGHSEADFTVVVGLNHLFADDLWDRMPHNLVTRAVPDDMARSVAENMPSHPLAHHDQVLNHHSLQRFLDLFAAAQMSLGTQPISTHHHPNPRLSNMGRIQTWLLEGANRHHRQYLALPPIPIQVPVISSVSSLWALQVAGIVVVVVPPATFDDLLLEMVVLAGSDYPAGPVGCSDHFPYVHTATDTEEEVTPVRQQGQPVKRDLYLPTPSTTVPNSAIGLGLQIKLPALPPPVQPAPSPFTSVSEPLAPAKITGKRKRAAPGQPKVQPSRANTAAKPPRATSKTNPAAKPVRATSTERPKGRLPKTSTSKRAPAPSPTNIAPAPAPTQAPAPAPVEILPESSASTSPVAASTPQDRPMTAVSFSDLLVDGADELVQPSLLSDDSSLSPAESSASTPWPNGPPSQPDAGKNAPAPTPVQVLPESTASTSPTATSIPQDRPMTAVSFSDLIVDGGDELVQSSVLSDSSDSSLSPAESSPSM